MKADNTINGRTPEEIKRGLECCINWGTGCIECPYDNLLPDECVVAMKSDNLDLIQQLEAERDQYKRERDAAVEQLTETSNEIGSCKGCVHYTNPGYKCYLWEANENCYEWRGVQEEVKI